MGERQPTTLPGRKKVQSSDSSTVQLWIGSLGQDGLSFEAEACQSCHGCWMCWIAW